MTKSRQFPEFREFREYPEFQSCTPYFIFPLQPTNGFLSKRAPKQNEARIGI